MVAKQRLLLVITLALIGGCGADQKGDSGTNVAVSSLPGVYAGTFPCDGCPGIHTRLWLQPDGRFFINQHYPAVEGRQATNAHNLGRWHWAEGDHALELDGAGPTRSFSRPNADTLVMRTHSNLEHRLAREPDAPDFSATIRMAGMVNLRGGGATFSECLTGLVVPVEKNREFTRLRHQYRSVGERGRPNYVELEGRFQWSRGVLQSMTIERFITIKLDAGCNS